MQALKEFATSTRNTTRCEGGGKSVEFDLKQQQTKKHTQKVIENEWNQTGLIERKIKTNKSTKQDKTKQMLKESCARAR